MRSGKMPWMADIPPTRLATTFSPKRTHWTHCAGTCARPFRRHLGDGIHGPAPSHHPASFRSGLSSGHMRLTRNVDGAHRVRALPVLGYERVRQTGSHIRLTTDGNRPHHISVPDHHTLKLGTLAAILKSVAEHHEKSTGNCFCYSRYKWKGVRALDAPNALRAARREAACRSTGSQPARGAAVPSVPRW